MVYGNVHCYNCGADFELYVDNVTANGAAVFCPHCCALLPASATKKLLDVFMMLEEVNKTLRKANADYNAPLFQIELRNHYVSPEAFDKGLNQGDNKKGGRKWTKLAE